jgi:DNA-binding NarL/FixJ family response regulator
MEIRVVIFEDSFLLRESLYQLINGSAGLTCVGAFSNCDDIVAHIEKTVPHVVLMDIQMPGKNGIEGVKIIKKTFPEIKMIMQTVVEDDDKIFASICGGASGYLLKNTTPSGYYRPLWKRMKGERP